MPSDFYRITKPLGGAHSLGNSGVGKNQNELVGLLQEEHPALK